MNKSAPELKRLAALLEVEEEELAFLSSLEAEQMQFLHGRINHAANIKQASLWSGLARATHLIPDRLNAKIAANFIGASATAQLSYHLSTRKALKIANHFSTSFLAEVAADMEPERAKTLIRAYPVDKTRAVGRYLLKQKNYYVMGLFLDYLTAAQALPILRDVQSDEAVLRIASYAQNKEALGRLVVYYSDGRLLSLLQKAHELELWDEVAAILPHLPPDQRLRIETIVAAYSSANP